MIEQCKQKFEDALTERTEALVSDIEKLKNRVRELDDLGDVNNMPVYVSDMRALRRKLTELEGVTEWINEQEALFKFPISAYPDIHQLQVSSAARPAGCSWGGGEEGRLIEKMHLAIELASSDRGPIAINWSLDSRPLYFVLTLL